MKIFYSLIFFFVCFSASQAQIIRRVNNNPGITGINVYTTIQAAHDAASPNDILIIEPSTTSYGGLTLTKPLKIYGNGYFLSTNTELKFDQRSSLLSSIKFGTGSGGSLISGVEFSGYADVVYGSPFRGNIVIYGVSNITIQRCKTTYGTYILNQNQAGTNSTNVSNITISQNYLYNGSGAPSLAAYPSSGFTISNVSIGNNIIGNSGLSAGGSGFGSDAGIQNFNVSNNTFVNVAPPSVFNSIFHSNLLLGLGTSPLILTNSTASYNISDGSNSFSSGTGNQNNYSVATELLGTGTGISEDEAYQIKTNSPLKAAGSGGAEVGAFGGTSPYVVSGIPIIPSIASINNTATGNNTVPLQVIISAMAEQNITTIEYFFDNDPGFNAGTSIPVTPARSITNFTFNINLTSATDGFHTLFVRAKDVSNNWSTTCSNVFYKLPASVVAASPNINKIEYFFDIDPGYGAGTNVPVSPVVSIANQNFTIPLSSAADGFHTLFMRTRDANNNWSAAYSRPFYKLSSLPLPPVPNINKLEYFIDADPGYGAGTNVAITPGVSIPDLSVPVPVTAIAEGNHTITFRARDANNNWSVVAIKSFSKCNHPTTTINAAASVTSSGFTASWADVPGSIGYRLDVSTDNFKTFVSGYNSKVVTAPALSSVVTGLAQATTYQYRVRAVASCTSVESNTENLTTLATPPSAQPTNFLFSSVTSTSLTAFFTAPSTAPTGYLVVRKVGSASTFTPTNNTSYTLGQDIGDGVVAYSGTTFLFNETGLTPDTQYFYRVFAYNQVNTSISYLTTSPLQSNVRTVALEPTAQPTNLQFAFVTDVGFTVSYTAAAGSPAGYLVLRKTGSAPTSTPADGTTYTTTVGTDAVVYNGTATTFPQIGLTQNTSYFYAVYAYNGSGTSLNYRVTTPLQGSQLTQISPPASAPTGLLFSNVTASSISVAFTAATGSPSGYLVVRKPGLSSTFAPQPNTLYTTGQVLSDGTVAYVGSSLNFIDNSLLANTTYFYDVFAYNQLGSQISYQSVAPLEGSRSTLAAEPATQPTSITFSSLAATGFTVSYTAATGSPSGYLAVRSTSVTPVFVPVDGTTYSVGTQGSEFISFIGAGNLFAETGLSTNTRYYYAIYAFNGSGATINYRSTSPLTGDQLTLLVAPTVQPTNITFNAVTSSAMSVGFTAAVGVSGYVVVRSSGASPTFIPQNNVSYSIGTQTGGEIVSVGTSTSGISNSGLAASTEYFYRVYAYNQNGAQISYNVISPLEGSRSTLAAEPAAQPTSITFSSLAATGFTVSFATATGSPSGYLAVRSTSATPVFVPVDGTTYSVGTQGSEFISFIGAGNLFAETGLSTNTRYYYAIYAFNGSGATINYRSTSPLTGDQLTLLVAPTVQPTNIMFNAVTSSAMTVGFTAAAGVSGYVVVRSSGASPTFIPQDNVSYTIGTQTGGAIVSVGSSTSGINNSGLAASTEYFYRVFSYNQNGAQISYNIISPLAGSKFTFTAEPTAQASGLVFSIPTINSLAINFTAASPAAAGYLIVRKAGVAATGLPSDGQSYALLDVIGDGVVAYIGTATSFIDNGLLAGTTYFYQVFSFNGAGILTNYLTTVNASNSGSKITVPGKPETPTASLVGQNQLTVNWIATKGADNYRLDLSKDNFVTRVSGFDNLAVNALTQPVSGLEPGTAYKLKVRAVNTSGTSVNSDEVQQFTIPATPVLTAATSVEQLAFTANWNLVTGATNYFIDVSLVNDFSTFLTGYQNKQLTNVSSEVITGLDAGKTYFYRLRSKNDGGPSPNSTSQNQLLLPATPVGSDATNQQSNSFKANWQAAQGATSYLLDVSVASTNFSPSLPNYTNKPIPLGTSDIVSNLSPSTEYRYRVRAVNASGASPSSVPIPVSTTQPPSGSILEVTAPPSSSSFAAVALNVPTTVRGGTPGYTVVFYHRKITGTTFTSATLTSSGTTYTAVITPAMLDELGVEFYFKVTDAIGSSAESPRGFAYAGTASEGQNIPFTKSGGTKESYELFSIPYQLADNTIANIFEELGAPNKAKYRLLRYQGGKNVDYGDGLTKIELGKGYWFNSKENVSINFSGGTVSQNNQSTDFILRLESGWNQIGNPFTFNVDWDDIVNLSASKDQIGKLKVFNPTQFTLTDESNSLKSWSGGFVFNSSSQAIELKMPVTLKNSAGGRKATEEMLTPNLGSEDWFLPITISQEGITNYSTGVGMHRQASPSKDKYDEVVEPRFINYLEFYTIHSDFFAPWFSKDVVPAAANYNWDFKFESNLLGIAKLNWDGKSLGENETQLFLFDVSSGVLIDMKKANNYSFAPKANQSFKIFYGQEEKYLSPDANAVATAWPNPFSDNTNVSFVVKSAGSNVLVSVLDLNGRTIKTIVNNTYNAGVYSAAWNGDDTAGQQVPSGFYLLRVQINEFSRGLRIIKN